jgi:hypothetical protein
LGEEVPGDGLAAPADLFRVCDDLAALHEVGVLMPVGFVHWKHLQFSGQDKSSFVQNSESPFPGTRTEKQRELQLIIVAMCLVGNEHCSERGRKEYAPYFSTQMRCVLFFRRLV